MAARKGLGVLGFSVGSIQELEPVINAYKTTIPNAEPVGAFVNDNVMVTTGAYVDEDADKAMELADACPTRRTSAATCTGTTTRSRTRRTSRSGRS